MTQQNTSRPGREEPAARQGPRRAVPGQGRHPWRMSWLASAAVIAAALTVAACGSSSSGGPASATPGAASGTTASSSALKTTTISGAAVLTDARGFTLYWFAPDTATTSKCNGSCAQIWPPVKGPSTAGPSVPGTLSTIARSDDTTQATYDGHPLYTYVGDTRPGQANGNNLNLNGGLWHEVTAGVGPSSLPPAGRYPSDVLAGKYCAGQPASPRTAASSPSKSSPHGPHACRCAARPG